MQSSQPANEAQPRKWEWIARQDITATFRKRTPNNSVIPVIKLPGVLARGHVLFDRQPDGIQHDAQRARARGQVQQATFGQRSDRVNQIFGTGGPRGVSGGGEV